LLVIDFEQGANNDEIRRRLPEMYRNWAEARRMRFELLVDERARDQAALRYACALSGFGCFRILRSESGWHIFEMAAGDRSVQRQRARVCVLAQSEAPDPERILARATIQAVPALADDAGGADPVRRYRLSTAPLVRDSARNYRSGRLDRILAGDFDLFGD
jgi:ATP-dependent Clp protease ATP-binding subunit ClpC